MTSDNHRPTEEDAVAARLGAALREEPLDAAAAARRATRRALDEGLVAVAYAQIDTPIGRLVAATTEEGLLQLAYEDFNGGLDPILDHLALRVSPNIVEAPERLDLLRRELEEYFDGRRQTFDVPIDWSLTSGFTQRVLQATAAIPFGAVSTYQAVAAKAGSPKATRAAGNALGSNPIPIVVPCHRVLRTGGGLGGYTGGVHKKEQLLALEGVLAG